MKVTGSTFKRKMKKRRRILEYMYRQRDVWNILFCRTHFNPVGAVVSWAVSVAVVSKRYRLTMRRSWVQARGLFVRSLLCRSSCMWGECVRATGHMSLFVSVWPCGELATCLACHPAVTLLWQQREALSDLCDLKFINKQLLKVDGWIFIVKMLGIYVRYM